MKNNVRKKSFIWIVLVAAVIAAGFVLATGTVLAETQDDGDIEYRDIGVNDYATASSGDFSEYSFTGLCFCPKKDGAISFTIEKDGEDEETTTTLLMKKNSDEEYECLNDDGETISTNPSEGFDRTVTYGVKKGVEYMLRVEQGGYYSITSKFKAVTENGGKKKAKAKSLKKGKNQYGLLPIGKKQSRWYKFKVPKTKTVTIQFGGWSNDYLCYEFMVKKQKKLKREVHGQNWDYKSGKVDNNENKKPKAMKIKLKKGSVIYMRVSNWSKESSGFYRLKCS